MTDYIEQMIKTAGLEGCSKEILFLGESPYPLFLGKQQLEIIKLIALQGNICITKRNYGDCNWIIGTHYKNGFGEHQGFTQALAQLTTELMKAGELDKEKVKEVLEG